MSVQDIRFKLILCLCMIFPPLLLSFSSAYPDLYYYNNFLTGQSPYTVTPNDFSSFEDTHHWEMYYPSYLDSSATQYSGIVTSFDTTFMSGDTIPSAVPGYDLDKLVGRSFVLPAGNAVVLYSGSGELTTSNNTSPSIGSSSNIVGVILGTTAPTANDYSPYVSSNYYYGFPHNMITDSNGNIEHMALPDVASSYVTSENLTYRYYNRFQLNNYFNAASGRGGEMISPYSWSYVWLLYNNNSFDVTISLVNWSGPAISVDSIPFSNISWIRTIYGYSTNNTGAPSSSNYVFGYILPHINADIDIYSKVFEMTSGEYFGFLTYFNRKLTFNGEWGPSPSTTDSNHVYNSHIEYSVSGGVVYRNSVFVPTSLLDTINNYNNLPIFIHTWNAQRSQYPYAISVKDGYISIDNYEELIDLLESSGFTGDLARVIALLEEINTGGETGAAAKELMDILEQYHVVIVETADDDFDTIYQFGWTQWKHLLDFSGSTIHWIVIANNALFNYFSGFIVLCAFFLVIDRIMRG